MHITIKEGMQLSAVNFSDLRLLEIMVAEIMKKVRKLGLTRGGEVELVFNFIHHKHCFTLDLLHHGTRETHGTYNKPEGVTLETWVEILCPRIEGTVLAGDAYQLKEIKVEHNTKSIRLYKT